MSKKVLIPIFAFAVAVGCSNSDDTNGVGKTGTAGSGAEAGAAGAAAGGGAGAGAGGADAGSESDGAVPVCNLETFCPIYLAYCNTTTPGYTTLAECMATFAAIGVADPYKQQCESYHLCNAIFDTGSDRVLHCSHAVGAEELCGL